MGEFSTLQAAGTQPEAFKVIDWSLYSVLVRNDRRAMGFKKAEEFSATIWRRARVKVTQETLYKIEQARQIPDTKQFMAINIALYGSPLPQRVVDTCLSREWRQIAEAGGDIPERWKIENFEEAAGDRADDPTLTPEELAAQVGDAPGLFENPNAPQPAQGRKGA